jgi:murein DD-endopeptidase MepM/ murein hydrolase activator NlpD
VGRVETVYAHLDAVDEAIQPGASVPASTPIGLIGNHGTATAAANGVRPQSIHLHWEILVDGHFLGEGLDVGATAEVYDALFGR